MSGFQNTVHEMLQGSARPWLLGKFGHVNGHPVDPVFILEQLQHRSGSEFCHACIGLRRRRPSLQRFFSFPLQIPPLGRDVAACGCHFCPYVHFDSMLGLDCFLLFGAKLWICVLLRLSESRLA